jgi:5-(carboxyamino)imidazole ribonucleotide mutase
MPTVSIIMGSASDFETMSAAADTLEQFGVAHEVKVVSAHRTPEAMFEFAKGAAARGVRIIIAGAGGAAHLPGMVSSLTTLPVLGVPVQSKALSGVDSLYSIVQMPAGVPTATFAIGASGATNAALFAVRMLAVDDAKLRKKLVTYRDVAAKKSLDSTATLKRDSQARLKR